MRCDNIIKKLERLAPVSYACEWDNPGLLAGRREKEVEKVFLALDATDEVIDQAVKRGTDLLITHHPLIFKPMKKINDDDFIGRRVLKLIQNDISYYAMHTNFDIAPGCMADLAAERLKLGDRSVLEPSVEHEGEVYGVGKTGRLPWKMSLEELGAYVKGAFQLPFVTVYGLRELTGPIERVAVSPGAGGSMVKHGIKAGAQVLITGDIGHHDGIDAVANGMAVIDAGHYGLEHLFMDFMEEYLRDEYGEELIVEKMAVSYPEAVL